MQQKAYRNVSNLLNAVIRAYRELEEFLCSGPKDALKRVDPLEGQSCCIRSRE